MNMTTDIYRTLLLALLLSTSAACVESSGPPLVAHGDAPAHGHGVPDTDEMLVHRTRWCGCCAAWSEQVEAAGFRVQVRVHDDLDQIKRALGVPNDHESCHTAEVEGYFIEGHVPIDDIRRLLAERPAARGLTVPGMPIGSPGMEHGSHRQPFDVFLIDNQGNATVYSHYPARRTR